MSKSTRNTLGFRSTAALMVFLARVWPGPFAAWARSPGAPPPPAAADPDHRAWVAHGKHLMAITAAFCAWFLVAALPAAGQPAPLPSRAPDLDQVAGVYKHRFANSDVSGDKYTSEDIFELVKITPKTAYFRIHGEFYNGHTCDLWGVADLEADALTYHGPANYHGDPCILKFSVNKDGIIVNDVGGACRDESCGARGGYGMGAQVDYPFTARRTIRYMPLILKSSEYADAVKEHDSHPVGTPSPAEKP
jgi:hypothetical protein